MLWIKWCLQFNRKIIRWRIIFEDTLFFIKFWQYFIFIFKNFIKKQKYDNMTKIWLDYAYIFYYETKLLALANLARKCLSIPDFLVAIKIMFSVSELFMTYSELLNMLSRLGSIFPSGLNHCLIVILFIYVWSIINLQFILINLFWIFLFWVITHNFCYNG